MILSAGVLLPKIVASPSSGEFWSSSFRYPFCVAGDEDTSVSASLFPHVESRVLEENGYFLPVHYISRIRSPDHVMERCARFSFAVENCPVDAGPAPIPGQQGAVYIEGTFRRQASKKAFIIIDR